MLFQGEKINMYKFVSIIIRNKKIVYGLSLSALIIIMSATTYSWFTASVSSAGKIQVGTFKLDINTSGSDINESPVIFNTENLQPGVPTAKRTVEFVNSGTIDMVLQGMLSLISKEEPYYNGVGSPLAYKVIASIYKNDKLLYSTPQSNGKDIPEDIEGFNKNLNSLLDSENGTKEVFKQNDKLICTFSLILSEQLINNLHQGDIVDGNFIVRARQNVSGATYDELK